MTLEHDLPMNPDVSTPDRFKIGEWTVEGDRHRLVLGATERKVEPKIMQVLLRLAATPGKTVARQELLDAVWGDVFVVDRVVNRAIWELRQAFGDDARAPRYIETIPKGGYRLVAPIHPLDDDVPAAPTAPTAAPNRRLQVALILGPLGLALVLSLALGRRTIEPAGRLPEVAQLTSARGWEYDPALSPDGHWLAFVAQNRDSGSWDLYRMSLDPDTLGAWQPLASADGSEGHPAWSPDGTRLAYYRHRPGLTTTLHVLTLANGKEDELLEVRAPYPELDWSPDGHRLAFRQELEGSASFAIYAVLLATREVERLTEPPAAWHGDGSPRFSPNGRHLAFVRSRGEGASDLYVLTFGSGEVRRLTEDTLPMGGIAWQDDDAVPLGGSRGEDTVIFSSRRGGVSDLWRMAIDGDAGPPERLGLDGWRPGSPSWRGRSLAFVSWASDTNIWRVPLETTSGEKPVQIVDSTLWDLHPAVAPDGRTIAFASNRSGHYEIWTADADGRDVRQRTRFEGPFTGTPRFSPNGARLVFDARPEGHADLYELELAGGEPRRLTTGDADEQGGFYGPDGVLVFASNRGSAWQVWIRDDGGERVLTGDEGFAPQVSPNGRYVYFVKPHAGGLWRVHRDGSGEVRVVEAVTLADAGAWTVGASGVYVVERGPGKEPDRIVYLDPATGLTELVWTAAAGLPYYDAAVAAAPDGKWLLVGQKDRSESSLHLLTKQSLSSE